MFNVLMKEPTTAAHGKKSVKMHLKDLSAKKHSNRAETGLYVQLLCCKAAENLTLFTPDCVHTL